MNAESTLTKPEDQTGNVERARNGHFYRPLVDIIEQPEELQLIVDMPGVKTDELDIRFEDGELRLHGPVKMRKPAETRFLLQEYGVGEFDRTFRISEQIDGSKIRAEFADGVLTLHLPKVETAKPRKIAVTSS